MYKNINGVNVNEFDLGVSYVTGNITLPAEFCGISIDWEENEFISGKGEVTRPDKDTNVNLKATFNISGSPVQREFPVTVAAKTSGYLAAFVARYEYNIGAEFAEFPSEKYTDNARTNVLYFALSKNGESYTALNNNKAILHPVNLYKMGAPALFRKPDGTFGLIASVDDTSQIIIFDSMELIFFDNQRLAALNTSDIAVKYPSVKYDNGKLSYNIYWVGGDGNSYITQTKDFITFSEPIKTDYSKTVFTGELPEYASFDDASVFKITADEYNRLEKKFGQIHSVGTDKFNDLRAISGTNILLPKTAKVNYSDGSSKHMSVEWDVENSGLDLNNPKKGTYHVSGKIKREIYVSPIAECRADPYIVYNKQDNMYYFTASYMQSDLNNAYSRLIVRKAETINGLKSAEEHVIWDGSKPDGHPWYWAPELHFIGGKWRMIVQAGVFVGESPSRRSRCVIYTCEGGDMTNPGHWELTGSVGASTNGKLPGSFDTTFFEYNGQSYYVSPSSSSIWIAKFNSRDPLTITSEFVRISKGDVGFEHNTSTKQTIQEGSSVMIHDGKIFILYAAATVDMHYAVGALYADVNNDLLDANNWKKYPYPLLSTQDLTATVKQPVFNADGAVIEEGVYKGIFGPGHNSITVDENGNFIIVYHARDWDDHYTKGTNIAKYGLLDPGRHAYANNIHFGFDGFPICNMTSDQQLAFEFVDVTINVLIE